MFKPEVAHEWLPLLLTSLVFLDDQIEKEAHVWNSFSWRGLNFRNPLGIAGGVDKTGDSFTCWQTLGCGFYEVGTVTPAPQSPNPGKIIDRHLGSFSLWNRMGFPSPGANETRLTLSTCFENRKIPFLINIGKNRNTTLEDAQNDYLFLINSLADLADVFVINISSPNTQGLRWLFSPERFEAFISPIIKKSHKHKRPILLKLSPDESLEQLAFIIDASIAAGIDGFITCNTTTRRNDSIPFPPEGGVSGQFLKPYSLESLKFLVNHLGSRKNNLLVISAGGISDGHDVKERLQIGANLSQIYSSIIFRGPYVFKKIAREIFL